MADRKTDKKAKSKKYALNRTSSSNSQTHRRASKGKNRYKYSVDDDRDEYEADFEREYTDGYNHGLQEARKKQNKKPQLSRSSSTKVLTPVTSNSNVADRASTSEASAPGPSSGSQHHQDPSRLHSLSEIVHEIVEKEDEHDLKAVQSLGEDLIEEIESEDENHDDNDSSSVYSQETLTLRERQDAINITHPFGIRIWKPSLYKKDRSVQRIAEGDIHSRPLKQISWAVWVGNALWSLTFGILLFLASAVSAFFCFLLFWSPSAKTYGTTFLRLGFYLWIPFGKCVQLLPDSKYSGEDDGEGRTMAEYNLWQHDDRRRQRLFFGPSNEGSLRADANVSSEDDDSHTENTKKKARFFGRGEWNAGRVMFFIWYYILLLPLLYSISLICWFGVFSIPMAKVTSTIAGHLRKHPLALQFRPASTLENLSTTEYSANILLCTYRAMGARYYKYTIDGTNIFLINLMFPVLFVIFDYYFLAETLKLDYFFTQNLFIFFLALAAVIPLAYFIGQAVASISAQTSMGMGATINAFFSTIVEVFLYCVALSQGKGDLVEGSIVGSIFAGVLLLPGLSMCAGAINRKTQRYNPNSAGVSSTMLLFAIIGAFAPTIFNQIYGTFELKCVPCDADVGDCTQCHFDHAPLTNGPFFKDILQPFSYWCSLLLFTSYCIGLWFTLRTHAAWIWASQNSANQPLVIHSFPNAAQQSVIPLHGSSATVLSSQPNSTAVEESNTQGNLQDPNCSQSKLKKNKLTQVEPIPVVSAPIQEPVTEGGHDAPNWSRNKSTVILLGATLLYAIIAEILVDTVDVVLTGTNISEKFLGITVFALVPNTTEFLNAISFAMHGNVSLSMEIGSAYALQVCLLQIPALALYSMKVGPIHDDIKDYMFTLIFPSWDLFMVIFCVFVFSYIYAEGKSNYFKGSILVLSYLVVMLGFYYAGEYDVQSELVSLMKIPAQAALKGEGNLQFVKQTP